jgi:hypothetical protein
MISWLFLITALFTSCMNQNGIDLEKILNPGALPYLKNSKLIQVSSHDTSGGNMDMITIPAGKAVNILQAPGPGVITRIWFRIDSGDPYFLRRILLRMYWDNEETPSVEVPFGDFFGCGFAYKQYTTPYLAMSSGGYTCFFPMPFEAMARIVIVNESPIELKGLYFQIDYQKIEEPLSTDIGYFHAYWHRDFKTNYDSNYTIFNIRGHGHIVGVNMNIQSYNHSFSFLEGDEKVCVDGEKKPSIRGTGTEDYFSSGWYFNKGEYAGQYNGLILKDDSLGRISAYRFHILDPIPFKKSINFTIEHGVNNMDIADYSSTVYWYQVDSHIKLPPILKSGLRIPLRQIPETNMLEAAKLTFNLGKIYSKVMNMSDYGPEWENNKQLLVESGSDDKFSLNLNNLEEIGYDVRIYYTRGPDYGNLNVYLGGQKVGEIKGYAPFIQPGGFVSIPDFKNLYHGMTFQFEVTGKDALSYGYFTGLIGIKLEPKREFIPVWDVIGPFPNKLRANGSRSGMDSIFPPEVSFMKNQVFQGLNGKPVSWQLINTPANGFISFDSVVSPYQPAVFYAIAYIHANNACQATLFIGSYNALKVLYNYKNVYSQKAGRMLAPDQGKASIKLNAGWNKLIIKIENHIGKFGFYARVVDSDHNLRYNIDEAFQKKPTDIMLKNQIKTWKHKGVKGI